MIDVKVKGSANEFFFELKEGCRKEWDIYTQHPFVQQLADGTLPSVCYQYYLVQLYMFLIHSSRAYALAVVKGEHLDDLRQAAAHVDLLLNYEIPRHVEYCERWGLSEDQLSSLPEADSNKLYTRYVIDQGMQGDLLDLLVSLSPCALGYSEIGARLITDPETRLIDNPYRDWIEFYSGEDYQVDAEARLEQLERVAKRRGVANEMTSNQRWDSLLTNFRAAVELEIGFFDMGLNPPNKSAIRLSA